MNRRREQDTLPSGQPLKSGPYLHPCTPARTSAWEPAAVPCSHLLPWAAVRKEKALTDLVCLCWDDKKDYSITQSCSFHWALDATTGTLNSPQPLFHRLFWPPTGLFKTH